MESDLFSTLKEHGVEGQKMVIIGTVFIEVS